MAKILTITTKTVVTLPDDVLGAAKMTNEVSAAVNEFVEKMFGTYKAETETTYRNGSGPRRAKAAG